VITRITSQHLAHNVYGDPITRDLVVYLPPSYESSTQSFPTRFYPTVYLLHGFNERATSWLGFRMTWAWRDVFGVLDDAIRRGRSREMIVVMPDGWSRLGCSQWIDSPANGNYEQYVVQDVVEFMDDHFRTIPWPGSRGVTGVSSGGFGAWHLGSRNPEVFGAMSLLSADSYFELTHKPWIYHYFDQLGGKEPNGPIDGEPNSWLTYGLASCYSPNLRKPPFYVDLPVSYPDGEIIPEIWEKWLDHDPINSYASRVANLERLRGILLDVGTRDEYAFHYGHRILSKRLSAAGVAHHVNEHDGTHDSRLYERIQATLEWFSTVLET
jgi:enterochelin esterase family protein